MIDPAELGYFEKTPGLGVWYHVTRGQNAFEPCICENPECRKPFMGRLYGAKARFCSKSCFGVVNAVRNGFGTPGRRNPRATSTPGYVGRHQRVRKERGPAEQFSCADDCGRQAKHWSQIHGTDGLDVFEHYTPRCVACHNRYDIDYTQVRGERSRWAKLTEAQVRDIRANAGASNGELAEIYGVHVSTISLIRNGKTWKHAIELLGGSDAQEQ